MSWVVTNDERNQYDYDTGGSPQLGHLITYRTGNGNTGDVFVPNAHYSAATVRTLVDAASKVTDEIMGLSSHS